MLMSSESIVRDHQRTPREVLIYHDQVTPPHCSSTQLIHPGHPPTPSRMGDTIQHCCACRPSHLCAFHQLCTKLSSGPSSTVPPPPPPARLTRVRRVSLRGPPLLRPSPAHRVLQPLWALLRRLRPALLWHRRAAGPEKAR